MQGITFKALSCFLTPKLGVGLKIYGNDYTFVYCNPEFCDDFLLDQERDVVQNFFFNLLFFQGALNQIRAIQKHVIRKQTVFEPTISPS